MGPVTSRCGERNMPGRIFFPPRHVPRPAGSALRYAARLSFLLAASAIGSSPAAEPDAQFLSDLVAGGAVVHRQDWGDFGVDTAAARPGTTGTPLQIGQRSFSKGLGHHANGEIAVDLRGQYSAFLATLGVQPQGGNRGSVVFRISVDGRTVLETPPMTDSDLPRDVEIPLDGAFELKLIAADAGDGIGCDLANWAEARLVRDSNVPYFGPAAIWLAGQPAPPANAAAGFALLAEGAGPQLAVMESARRFTASVNDQEEIRVAIPVTIRAAEPLKIAAEVRLIHGTRAEVELAIGDQRVVRALAGSEAAVLAVEVPAGSSAAELIAATRGVLGEAGVRWSRLRYASGDQWLELPLAVPRSAETIPPPVLPEPRAAIAQEMIEWDWRMQDGIGTPREPRSWQQAIGVTIQRGDGLLESLAARGVDVVELAARWEALRAQVRDLADDDAADEDRDLSSVAPREDRPSLTDAARWEELWRQTHQLRRQIALHNPLAETGPLLFIKRVPSSFSHQLTQYAGRCARPGGGVFVLDQPGRSMASRQLVSLPEGSFLHPEVSWDGSRVMFAFCQTDPGHDGWRSRQSNNQFYHLFEVGADGSGLKQLTSGPYDHFSPRYLPDGKILFLSTRRGGFHRCGQGPCPVHTMGVCEPDGSSPRVISFHETHEWDPAVLNDGRVIYTRWDYVDRHAVFYQQLWTVRPDGSDVRAFYGNNTLNPIGVWEARPVPGSTRIMATAAAHHAMTAGSIILLDTSRGIDHLEPITRLTPDALFPESEFPVGNWHNPAGVLEPPQVPVEEKRWPGHSYRTPYPLSDEYFLAAYSFDPLIGEPHANRANMFGIYLVDRFGNKELLYRDASISSLWPAPLRARSRPPALPANGGHQTPGEGSFLLQNVYESWPQLVQGEVPIRSLRILQVLPKTTPNANSPRVGLANASPGKQVLGTVPVEADGSAYFSAPAGIPLSFQALDARGMAVQTMRSLTYLQPGEQTGCVGCHEHRTVAPVAGAATLAGQRAPSIIQPGPDGSKPFNYAILVQPILDKHCVSCHAGERTDGGIDLSGTPSGEFSVSYQALAPRVPFSEWKGTPQANFEPLTYPDRFGARASSLLKLIVEGHEDVVLSPQELECLVTWMDTNALFYGTFDPADQRRQQRGERIAGPALE